MSQAGGKGAQLPPPQILADQKASPGSGGALHYYLPPPPPGFLDFATCLLILQKKQGFDTKSFHFGQERIRNLAIMRP